MNFKTLFLLIFIMNFNVLPMHQGPKDGDLQGIVQVEKLLQKLTQQLNTIFENKDIDKIHSQTESLTTQFSETLKNLNITAEVQEFYETHLAIFISTKFQEYLQRAGGSFEVYQPTGDINSQKTLEQQLKEILEIDDKDLKIKKFLSLLPKVKQPELMAQIIYLLDQCGYKELIKVTGDRTFLDRVGAEFARLDQQKDKHKPAESKDDKKINHAQIDSQKTPEQLLEEILQIDDHDTKVKKLLNLLTQVKQPRMKAQIIYHLAELGFQDIEVRGNEDHVKAIEAELKKLKDQKREGKLFELKIVGERYFGSDSEEFQSPDSHDSQDLTEEARFNQAVLISDLDQKIAALLKLKDFLINNLQNPKLLAKIALTLESFQKQFGKPGPVSYDFARTGDSYKLAFDAELQVLKEAKEANVRAKILAGIQAKYKKMMDEKPNRPLLHCVIFSNDVANFKTLMAMGVDYNQINHANFSALHCACYKRNENLDPQAPANQILDILLSQPHLVYDIIADAGYNAVHVACEAGNLYALRRLLETGKFNLGAKTIFDEDCYDLAKSKRFKKIENYIFEFARKAGLLPLLISERRSTDFTYELFRQ